MVQVDPQKHSPVQIAVILAVLVLLSMVVGFVWVLTNEKESHQSRLDAIDKQTMLGQFESAFNAGELDRAVTQAELITETYPDDAIGYLYVATAQLQASSIYFEEALRVPIALGALEKVLAMSTSKAEYYRLLGHAYTLQGQSDLALRAYTDGIAQDEGSPRGYTARAYLHMHLDRFDDAQSDFLQALERNPEYALANIGEAELLLKTATSTTEAFSFLDTALSSTKNRLIVSRVQEVRGALSYTKDDYEESLTSFYDALEYNEQSTNAMLGTVLSELALAQESNKEITEYQTELISETLERARKVHGSLVQSYVAAGVLSAMQDDQKERRTMYEKALSLLSQDKTLTESSVSSIRTELLERLNKTTPYTPTLYLNKRPLIDHCVACE